MVKTSLPTHKYFRTEDVNVRYAGHAGLEVRRLPMPTRRSMPASGGFRPGRRVINLELVDPAKPSIAVLHFDPPIQFRIRYTKDDLDDAHLAIADRNQLPLAYWDDKRKQWILFTVMDHQLNLDEWDATNERGLAVVNIYDWGDPPIAIGT